MNWIVWLIVEIVILFAIVWGIYFLWIDRQGRKKTATIPTTALVPTSATSVSTQPTVPANSRLKDYASRLWAKMKKVDWLQRYSSPSWLKKGIVIITLCVLPVVAFIGFGLAKLHQPLSTTPSPIFTLGVMLKVGLAFAVLTLLVVAIMAPRAEGEKKSEGKTPKSTQPVAIPATPTTPPAVTQVAVTPRPNKTKKKWRGKVLAVGLVILAIILTAALDPLGRYRAWKAAPPATAAQAPATPIVPTVATSYPSEIKVGREWVLAEVPSEYRMAANRTSNVAFETCFKLSEEGEWSKPITIPRDITQGIYIPNGAMMRYRVIDEEKSEVILKMTYTPLSQVNRKVPPANTTVM
ncbi:hypothetical protein KW807_01300 [Candidatus Parcubacteria bacterium]|nr:hypothetical protein [Candidatus Parcubacteria bacterium]